MTRIKICKESDCHNTATTAGYCRLHYLKNWKSIKTREKQRSADKLNRYIENICQKHPDNYVEIIKKDLRSPHFEKYIENTFGYDEEDVEEMFEKETYDEELDELLKQLRIEKDYK